MAFAVSGVGTRTRATFSQSNATVECNRFSIYWARLTSSGLPTTEIERIILGAWSILVPVILKAIGFHLARMFQADTAGGRRLFRIARYIAVAKLVSTDK